MPARPVLWGEGLGNDPSYPADLVVPCREARVCGGHSPNLTEAVISNPPVAA